MTDTAKTARTVTQTLRQYIPAPATLSSRVNPGTRNLEVTIARGYGRHADAEQVVRRIQEATGQNWTFISLNELRSGNFRAVYTLLPAKTDFTEVGRPETWELGQADEDTVHARHAAIRDTQTPTGFDAQPGQLVRHVELGDPGEFIENAGGDGTLSYVRFAGETDRTAVYSGDVVVLPDWMVCWRLEDQDVHADHGQAVMPECIIEDPDQELVGPEITPAGPNRWTTTDGIEIFRDSKTGTYAGYALVPNYRGSISRDSIFGNQKRIEAAHRPINNYRADVAAHAAAMQEIAGTVDAIKTALRAAKAKADLLDALHRDAVKAGRTGDYERRQCYAADITVDRILLALDNALGQGEQRRFVAAVHSTDEGSTWEVLWARPDEARDGETASAHALRYAEEKGFTRYRSTIRPLPWRIEVYSDPIAETPDGVWTNFTDPCAPGEHDTGKHPSYYGPERADGSFVQTNRCARCFHGVWRVAPFRAGDNTAYTEWVLEGEPLPGPDPAVICLPIEKVQTAHYGMEIHDGFGTWHRLVGVGVADPETGNVPVEVDDRTGSLPVGTAVQLRPAGPGPDGTQTRTPDPDPTGGNRADKIGAGPDRPVALGFRIQTRTAGTWRAVRTDRTPAGYPSTQTALDGLAETVLSNIGPVLGLGPGDPIPPVRVRTWNPQTGLTGAAGRVRRTRS